MKEQVAFFWIIGILILFLFFSVLQIYSLRKKGFKRKKVYLPTAKIHLTYFTQINNEKSDDETINQLDLMLTNAGYHGSTFVRTKQFDELAANLGYHHIVFSQDAFAKE